MNAFAGHSRDLPAAGGALAHLGAMKVLKKQDWFHEDGFPIVVERATLKNRLGFMLTNSLRSSSSPAERAFISPAKTGINSSPATFL